MNFEVLIDKEQPEKIIIYAHKRTALIDAIEQLVKNDAFELIGYKEREAYPLNLSDVYCFVVEDNKIFALTKGDKFQIKFRLYQLKEKLPENFVKINQSCIANINGIQTFNAAISGTLTVQFKNGYCDYVSRRNLKDIKERFGL